MYYTREEYEQIILYKSNRTFPEFMKDKPRSTIFDFKKRVDNYELKIDPKKNTLALYKNNLILVPKESVQQILSEIYNSPEGFSTGRDDLFKKVRSRGYLIHASSCQEFLNSLRGYQLHKQVKPTTQDRIFTPSRPLQLLIADTTTIDPFNGFSMLLNVVDAFSKKAWSVPIKKQNAKSIETALTKILDEIIKETNVTPSRIQFDNGSEFKNETIKKLLEAKNIKMSFSSSYNFKSQGMVERFHQTLKRKLYIYMTANNTKNWVEVLPVIIKNYNNTVHTTTGRTPDEVFFYRGGELEVQYIYEQKRFESSPPNDLQVGTKVRILHQNFIERQKNKLLKGYVQQWSDEIYVVRKVIKPTLTKINQVNSEKINLKLKENQEKVQ